MIFDIDGLNMNDKMASMNIKIKKSSRDKMKAETHKRGSTVQSTISAFCESYNDDPDRFKMVLVEVGQ